MFILDIVLFINYHYLVNIGNTLVKKRSLDYIKYDAIG